jgi:ADP-dependent NAD(P)H-hydrate dehydratase / NAD(P)H-hydrate epimerase
MQILSSKQLRELDNYTIEHLPISSIDLMERAARALFSELVSTEPHSSVTILCGLGNNGGDGLALARMMRELQNCEVQVVVIDHTSVPSPDFSANLVRLQHEGATPITLHDVGEIPEIAADALVVDALLGTGLSRPVSGLLADVIAHINGLPNRVVSIDVPSGLFCEDNEGNDLRHVVRADRTMSFHCPKLSFMFSEHAAFVGDLTVLDIGLMEKEASMASQHIAVTAKVAGPILRPRARFSHKGTYGHALLLAGRRGSMGACVLSSRAVLRSGAGLLTAHVAQCGSDVLQTAVPEAMCSVDPNHGHITELPDLSRYAAIGMGPGIGRERDTANVLKMLIQEARMPIVLDADAINILADNPTWLSFLPRGTILTPHPKEFDRLVGQCHSGQERWIRQREFSVRYGCVVVLKGAFTSICNPSGQTFFNMTGNPGMATAGTGDVLTGSILGLMAQGYGSTEASVLGVYVHGLSGDMVAKRLGMHAMVASDLTEGLGAAFLHLLNG